MSYQASACEVCGRAVLLGSYIEDADGNRVHEWVGSGCAKQFRTPAFDKRVADRRKAIAAALKADKKLAKKLANQVAFETAEEMLAAKRELIAAKPHPLGFSGKSYLDYVEYLFGFGEKCGPKLEKLLASV
jgi:hypothetical protein